MAGLLDAIARCVTARALDELRAARAVPDEQRAQDIAALVAADLRREWGGDRPYIALGYREWCRERQAQIRAAHHDGANVRELMQRFRVARQTVYDAINHRQRWRR
jgi:Mor family transcriptional regulator